MTDCQDRRDLERWASEMARSGYSSTEIRAIAERNGDRLPIGATISPGAEPPMLPCRRCGQSPVEGTRPSPLGRTTAYTVACGCPGVHESLGSPERARENYRLGQAALAAEGWCND